jgi:hypothetical protein
VVEVKGLKRERRSEVDLGLRGATGGVLQFGQKDAGVHAIRFDFNRPPKSAFGRRPVVIDAVLNEPERDMRLRLVLVERQSARCGIASPSGSLAGRELIAETVESIAERKLRVDRCEARVECERVSQVGFRDAAAARLASLSKICSAKVSVIRFGIDHPHR